MNNAIKKLFEDSIAVKKLALEKNADVISQTVDAITKVFKNGGKILFCGNGGSAADSQHIAAEFIGRFKKERQSLPAIALTTDTSILTAIGNDYGFDYVFSRQVEGLGKKGDVLVGISTSGNSPNVIEAVKAAKIKGLITISLTGNDGGKLASLTDYSIVVPSKDTARIQESHICISHIICELAENSLGSKK